MTLRYALPLVVALWLLVLVDARRRTHAAAGRRPGRGRALVTVLAVLTVAAAGVAGFHVYRVGDSGARSVWAEEVGG